MSDFTTNRPLRSFESVNLSCSVEVDYWCNRFHCTREDLERTITALGTTAADRVSLYFEVSEKFSSFNH